MSPHGLLYDWQTLIAGMLALIGAIITVLALNKQARDAAERKAWQRAHCFPPPWQQSMITRSAVPGG